MGNPGQPISISISAPGKEVWDYMKIDIVIRYLQKNKWYCVTYGLASALDYTGNCYHVIKELLQLAPCINGKKFKHQAEMIKNTYNYVFKSDRVYGLG